ncbi:MULTISPECIES: carbohydrate ABC transporter permease [unclassified Mesorhizobium]|uniref:carbohydrate ABC transporter permease n=1 Tax=unclassified Mesorhizobium TaxID=325217 RepID=UPI000FCC4C2A|nr:MULTISPECIES: carbohydrate ABC transporter permease [unclassified Mesorhizobium]RUW99613.1 carbohydrate ABC transporter permease [Mesorhizobium sp. M8A.F.Ca.ET.023.01.1.1]RVD47696.1 carbohydrate ABC transporter permease [Mesorhizobium sp. M8A.F.Ca.ET.023.02.2.1]TGR37664.1 carbohydrate ABC transporter permease [bacterium M00.F.Ca.ET.199.01.1.1]TGU22646.1 carbohydrate ABC transporter permease [bacterium M00.F.Ca.ET.156.01.1.1]TGV82855.1 carbohydrate ABC transporter permease [Mesorhizobium sp.
MTSIPAGRLIRFALLSLGALMILAPYIFMISTAGKTQSDIFTSSLSLIPEHFYFAENFAKAFAKVPMATLLWNGVIVCGLIFFFQVLVAIPCAYAMAKLKFRAARLMMVLVMLGLLVPIHATALPLYVAFDRMSLLNSYTSLVAPFTISVFAIFMFLQFFRAMPDDLIHAARLDGMSELGIVARVIVPNAWPAVTAFAIFSVVAHWNDLYWPLIVVSKQAYATPPLGLMYFRAAEAGDDYGALMAATLIITLPLVVAFLFAQKRFVEGITMTGLKG